MISREKVVMWPERLHHITEEEAEQTPMASIVDYEKVSIFLKEYYEIFSSSHLNRLLS